jgi:hypothetical protein
VPSACSPAEIATINAYRLQFLQQVAAAPAAGAFIDSCIVHSQNVG